MKTSNKIQKKTTNETSDLLKLSKAELIDSLKKSRAAQAEMANATIQAVNGITDKICRFGDRISSLQFELNNSRLRSDNLIREHDQIIKGMKGSVLAGLDVLDAYAAGEFDSHTDKDYFFEFLTEVFRIDPTVLVQAAQKVLPKFQKATQEVIDSAKKKVLEECRNGRKIMAIKALRDASGLGLKESKDLVEKWWDEYRASNPTNPVL